MKTLKFFISIVMTISLLFVAKAQSTAIQKHEKVAVVEADVIGIDISPKIAGEIIRRELMKLNLYNVADSYDQQYIMDRNSIQIEGCYSVYCLQEIADVFDVDKIITGSFTRLNNSIIITIKLFDTNSNTWAKMSTETFNDIPDQINLMVSFTLRTLLELDYDVEMYRRLTSDVSFYRNVELMEREEAKQSGPRFGVGFLTGDAKAVITAPKEVGGADGFPIISHIGYQFEKVFISSGSTHALMEFLPTISGLEQGIIIPAMNILLGVRNSKTGFEFGMGYNISAFKENIAPPNAQMELEPIITSGLLIGVGKTFKSGRLNFPVNLYYIPGKNNTHRFGMTFGYNITKV